MHLMCPWSFISRTSFHRLFFKPIKILAVDTNSYFDVISTNYMCECLHFVLMVLWYSGEWMASWLKKISSGNGSRSLKEKIMKWVFQTLVKDCDWITLYNYNIHFTRKLKRTVTAVEYQRATINTPRGFHVQTTCFHVVSTWNPRGVFLGRWSFP